MHGMATDWFAVYTDHDTNLRYVVNVMDEETKNHETIDQAITTGHKPKLPGQKMCPVTSYLTYMEHLSPKSESVW